MIGKSGTGSTQETSAGIRPTRTGDSQTAKATLIATSFYRAAANLQSQRYQSRTPRHGEGLGLATLAHQGGAPDACMEAFRHLHPA